MQASPKPKNPLLWVPTSYFTMGLMYILLTNATVIMFSNLGMDNAAATKYSSLLGLAYMIKPFFAAFFEMYRTKKFFVILAQTIIGLGLFAVALAMNLPNYFLIMLVMFWVLSFVGSSQDIAADGVYVTGLDSKSQAKYTGWQSLSWNLGRLAVMSVLVGLSGYLHENVFNHDPHVKGPEWSSAWQIVMVVIGLWYLAMAAWHWRVMPDGSKTENPPRSAKEALMTLYEAFVSFFQKQGVWLMIGFALLFRLSYGFLAAPSILFMQDSLDNGGFALTNTELSWIYGTFGTAANVIGSFVGGLYIVRKGLQKALFPLCFAVNIPNVTFLLLALAQPHILAMEPTLGHAVISAGVVLEQFFFGMGSVGFMIYLMQQLAPGKFRTAHYAFGTGLMALCIMLTGYVSGTLQIAMGYIWYFVFVMIATIPSFIVCWFAPFHHKEA